MALTLTKKQYQELGEHLSQVYNQSTEVQRVLQPMLASFEGTASVVGFELTQSKLDARENSLKSDWAKIKSEVALIDSILGV